MRSTWIPKIMSLLIAFSLWVYVMNELNPPLDAAFSVTMQTENLNSSLMVLDLPEVASIKVRAPRVALNNFKLADVHVYVDLKGLTEGRYSLPVKVRAPQTLNVLDVQPNTVVVQVQSKN